MKILCVDRLLKGRPHADWKEGWEMFYAFNKIGVECDIAGLDCPISEEYIPEIQKYYDFIIVTENHQYEPPGWKWWNWEQITTPKMFWAIDTHTKDFLPWLKYCEFDYVGLNNKQDLDKYNKIKRFYLPYGVSSKHYSINIANKKAYDITFIGSLTPERQRYINEFNMKHIMAFGYDYVREIQKSKICFNKSVSYDLNAKYFEIMASGTFMLSNYNEILLNFVKHNKYIEQMMYRNDDELKYKINYYLKHEDEREDIAINAKKYIIENHSYENRCRVLWNNIINKSAK